MKRFLFLLFLLGGAARVAAQGISVSPARLFFTGVAGERVSQVLTMTNPTGKTMRFRLVLRDFYRDSVGEKVYGDAGSMPGSNAGWVDGLPDVVELAPGEKRDLPVYLRIPLDTLASQRGVSRSILFLSQVSGFDSAAARAGNRKVGVLVRLEVGIQIYYTPGWCSRRSLEFIAFDERGRVGDSVRRWAVRVRNNGEVSTDVTFRVELTEKGTGKETAVPEKKLTLLPGAEQVVYIDLPLSLHPGRYLAVAFLDTGDQNDLKVAEKDIVY